MDVYVRFERYDFWGVYRLLFLSFVEWRAVVEFWFLHIYRVAVHGGGVGFREEANFARF